MALSIPDRFEMMQRKIDLLQQEIDKMQSQYLASVSAPHIPASSIDLLESVAQAFGLCAKDLTGRQRNKWLSYARVTVVHLLIQRGNSTPVIGRILGKRDHSTIISLRNKLEQYRTECPLIDEVMRTLSDGNPITPTTTPTSTAGGSNIGKVR